jgi:restriction endonuclease S subunit
MKHDFIIDTEDHISQEAVEASATRQVSHGAILCVVRSGILAHTFPIAIAINEVAFNQDIIALIVKDAVLYKYLYYMLKNYEKNILSNGVKRGGTVHSLQNGFLKTLCLPIPSIEIQQKIVQQIDKEKATVDANKELIAIMEKKIKDKIDEVWEE